MKFVIEDGVLKKCENPEPCLIIPEGIKEIARGVFEDSTILERVTLPDGLKKIESSCFSGCSNLQQINLPDSLEVIEAYAFFGCSFLQEIHFPKYMSKIGFNSFTFCDNLHVVSLPKNVKKIEFEAFSKCNALQTIRLPDNIEKINSKIFEDCAKLTHIAIPSAIPLESLRFALEGIPRHAIIYGKSGSTAEQYASTGRVKHIFKDLAEFPDKPLPFDRNIYQPEYIKSLYNAVVENGVLKRCNSDISVIIPSGVRVISSYLFNGHMCLKYVEFPSGLEEIDTAAFGECSLTELILPDGVWRIGEQAFQKCYLEKIELPNSIVDVGVNAFEASCFSPYPGHPAFQTIGSVLMKYTGSASDIKVPDGITCIAAQAFSRVKSKIAKIQLPKSLLGISSQAFKGCVNLETPEIPEGIVYIGLQAFSECPKIKTTITPQLAEIGGNSNTESGKMIWENPEWQEHYAKIDKNFEDGLLKKINSIITKDSFYVLKKDGHFYSEANEFPAEEHIQDFIIMHYYNATGGLVAAIRENGKVILHIFGNPPEKNAARWNKIVKGLEQENEVSKLIPCFYKTVQILVLRKDGSLITYGSGGKSANQLVELAKGKKIKKVFPLYDDFVAETEDGKLIGTGGLSSVEKIHSYSQIEWTEDSQMLLLHFLNNQIVMCHHDATVYENVRKIVSFHYGELLLGTNGQIAVTGFGFNVKDIERLNKIGKIQDILTFGQKSHESLAVLYRSGEVLIDGKFVAENVEGIYVDQDRIYADYRTNGTAETTERNTDSNKKITSEPLENFSCFPPEKIITEPTEFPETEMKLQKLAQAVVESADLPEQYKKYFYNIFANIYGYGTLLAFSGYVPEVEEQFFGWEYDSFCEALTSHEIIEAMGLDIETVTILFRMEALQERIFDIYNEQVSDEENHPGVAAYFKKIVNASSKYSRLMRKAVRYLADQIGVEI